MSQPGRFGTTTVSQKASWVIVTSRERVEEKEEEATERTREDERMSGEDVLLSSLFILPQIPRFREMM